MEPDFDFAKSVEKLQKASEKWIKPAPRETKQSVINPIAEKFEIYRDDTQAYFTNGKSCLIQDYSNEFLLEAIEILNIIRARRTDFAHVDKAMGFIQKHFAQFSNHELNLFAQALFGATSPSDIQNLRLIESLMDSMLSDIHAGYTLGVSARLKAGVI